jgi:Flp pilus assembly protein TadG
MTVKIMKPVALSGWLATLWLSAAKFRRDTRGLAAVEFAIIVPLMLAMFFATVELSSGVAANRKVSTAAEELADLVSRYTNVNDTDFTNFFTIGQKMMTPFSSTPLKATITEIYIDATTGVGRAQWSKGDYPRAVGSTVPVAANLISRDASNNIIPGQYLIFSEISYIYTPAVGYIMQSPVTLSDTTYMRPRLSPCVFYPQIGGTCPTS